MDSAPPPHYAANDRKEVRNRIVIQGVKGSFHDIAARHFWGQETLVVPAATFDELALLAADRQHSDAAIMAIENTIAGSILPNYSLLQNNSLHIVGEVFLRIKQNLLAMPGVDIRDLREVHSHPVALAQCKEFFRQYPHIRLVESDDTAASAERVARRKMKHTGAIASVLAAETFGLQVLAPSIETYRKNYTRFLAVQSSPIQVPDADKVSVSFTVPNEAGSLNRILQLLSARGANMTKIQSVPLPDHPWEYFFFVDFQTNSPYSVVEALETSVAELKVLGIYKTGKTYEE